MRAARSALADKEERLVCDCEIQVFPEAVGYIKMGAPRHRPDARLKHFHVLVPRAISGSFSEANDFPALSYLRATLDHDK